MERVAYRRVWAIPARNMRATATMPASSWRTRSTPNMASGPGAPSSKACCRKASWPGRKTYLLKPQTYMNDSGDSVGPALRFFKLPLARWWWRMTRSTWRQAS